MQVERCFRGAGQKEKRLLAGERVRNAWESAEQFGPNPEES
ncbi:hypothetical protein AAZX31_U036000 [Glycine max]